MFCFYFCCNKGWPSCWKVLYLDCVHTLFFPDFQLRCILFLVTTLCFVLKCRAFVMMAALDTAELWRQTHNNSSTKLVMHPWPHAPHQAFFHLHFYKLQLWYTSCEFVYAYSHFSTCSLEQSYSVVTSIVLFLHCFFFFLTSAYLKIYFEVWYYNFRASLLASWQSYTPEEGSLLF